MKNSSDPIKRKSKASEHSNQKSDARDKKPFKTGRTSSSDRSEKSNLREYGERAIVRSSESKYQDKNAEEPKRRSSKSDNKFEKPAFSSKSKSGNQEYKGDSRPIREKRSYEKNSDSKSKFKSDDSKRRRSRDESFQDKPFTKGKGKFDRRDEENSRKSDVFEKGDIFVRKNKFEKNYIPAKKFESNREDFKSSKTNFREDNRLKTFDNEWLDEREPSKPEKRSLKPSAREVKYSPYAKTQKKIKPDDGSIRLNRYLANAGICSRRDADQLIKSGVVKVNGIIVSELGVKVMPGDVVKYGDQTLSTEKKQYLLLNKPKNYITTSDDPDGRKTVFELINNACKERLYPVGRLDKATMGLLLFTNDGELAKKLTHPSGNVKKLYHVHLDKNLKKGDLLKIANGEVILEDGQAEVDEISYVGESKVKNEVGLMLHSGKNRIVRRIFEHLGYKVTKLDRVSFGGLTKKDLPRGRYRFLTEKEIGYLKML